MAMTLDGGNFGGQSTTKNEHACIEHLRSKSVVDEERRKSTERRDWRKMRNTGEETRQNRERRKREQGGSGGKGTWGGEEWRIGSETMKGKKGDRTDRKTEAKTEK